MLKIFLAFFAFVIVLVSADDPFIPCQSFISFSYDDSYSLSSNGFKAQMNFIKNEIRALNYPSRLRAEGGYGGEFTWNSKLSIIQMQSLIDAAEQTSIPYSLLQQFSSLATNYEVLGNYSSSFGAIIFISDTSDSALKNADRLFPKLNGIRLTFVLLGSNADSAKLRSFTSNFLYWQDLSQPSPDNWDLLSYHAYGCDTPYISSSTMSIITRPPTTPVLGSYYPCENWITVLTENSNGLTAAQFQKQLKFTKTFTGQITHFERIRYGTYNEQRGTLIYPWSSNNNQNGFNQAIDSTNQTTSGTNVLKAIQLLVSDENQNRTLPDSTLIFVTDTSNNFQIQQAVDLYNRDLKNIGIKLTFILAGQNTNANALSGFDDAIFYNWQNIGVFPQPDQWDLSSALRCTTIIKKSTSTMITSSISTITSTATTAIPYLPCKSWISFSYDDSNTLQSADYKTQMLFIESATGSINYPDRLRLGGAFTGVASWNSHQTISQIQNELNSSQSTPNSYSLLLEVAGLLTDVEALGNTTWRIGALIFISDTSEAALHNTNIYFSQLPPNVRITFVLLGSSVDSSTLTQFSNNFIYWSDLSQSRPDNWDTLSYAAYGCQ